MGSGATDLLDELAWRGMLAQVSDDAGLRDHLAEDGRVVYCGFDPTADSLHIGNLVPLLGLARFQRAGHTPLLLLGGATGMIGDPSGRSDERNLNDQETVNLWVERIRAQVEKFVDFSGEHAAKIVNNLDWTQGTGVMDFLRDVGKHFSVNAMIQRDSVRSRLERDGAGISFTEFSYMLLQANDFAELFMRHHCTIQIGGSDQWGNIVSGVDLVRRRASGEAYALTFPLVTKADGTKFGKTGTGTIWLAPDKTSPYAFYQFWLNSSDADVVNFLKYFTFLNAEEVEALAQATTTAPAERQAQRRLASEVTQMVHGDEALASAQRITAALFGGELDALTEDDFSQLALDGLPTAEVGQDEGLLNAMVACGAAGSTGEARKLVQGGGVRLNGEQQTDPKAALDFGRGSFQKYFVMRRGKKNYYLLSRILTGV